MITWPSQHRNLAAIVGVILAAFVAGYVLLIRPKQQEVAQTRTEMETLQTKLVQKGWPLDSSRLEKLREEKSKELARFVKLSDDVLQDATRMFDPKITSLFENADNFRNNVSRLDYKEEFIQAEQHFRDQGVIFGEDVLKLSENSDSPYTYQLVLQLWTLRSLTDLALKYGLRPAVDPRVRTEGDVSAASAPIAKLTVLPMKAYVSYPGEKEPYLLEFPIRMVLVGHLENLCNFLRALHGPASLAASPDAKPAELPEHNFFPVSRLEVHKAMPSWGQPSPDQIEADIQCSSFYRLRASVPKPVENKVLTLPAGG